MTMTKLSDYYAVVLTNKWFYFSILATVVSALLLVKWLSSFVQDYIQFGPIADLQVPALHFLYLTFRYSIPLTEIGILSWEWYAPIEAEAKEPPWKIIAYEKERVEAEVQEVRTSGYLINTMQLFTLSRKFLTLRRVQDSNL